jgi:DNA-binding NtrC family response regulator
MTLPAKILIVDDDPSILRTYDRILHGWGYEVHAVASAEEALQLQPRFDLVLLDMILPGMSGIDFLRVCKRRRQHTLVIVLTAYASIDSAVEAAKLGAYSFISKPCTMETLQDHVDRVLKVGQDPLIAHLKQNLDHIQSREELAQHFGISPGTVLNRIRRATSLSFADFLLECRIEKAKNLLLHTELTAAQVADRVGFSKPQSLSRAFRRQVQLTPHQYRRQARMGQI